MLRGIDQGSICPKDGGSEMGSDLYDLCADLTQENMCQAIGYMLYGSRPAT